jgi:hypothetical protein
MQAKSCPRMERCQQTVHARQEMRLQAFASNMRIHANELAELFVEPVSADIPEPDLREVQRPSVNVTRSVSRTPASASGSTRLRRSCWRSKLTQPSCAATPCVARTSCRHAICCSIQAFSTSSKCCSASGHERCEYQASLSDLILTNT